MEQEIKRYNAAQGRQPLSFSLRDAGIVFSCFILANFALSLLVEIVLTICGLDPVVELSQNETTIWIVQITLHVILLLVSILYYVIRKGSLADTGLKKKLNDKDLWFSLCLTLPMFYLANLVTNIIVNILMMMGYTQSMGGVEINNWFSFCMALLGVVLLPAFSEELVFRGIAFQGLKRYGKAAAIFGSALLFGIMHMNVVQLVYAFLCGMLLGLVVYKTDNIKYGIIMHGLSNLLSVVVTFVVSMVTNPDGGKPVMTEEALMSNPFVIIFVLVIFILSVLGLIFGLKYFLKDRPREPWEQPVVPVRYGINPYYGVPQGYAPYGVPHYGMPGNPQNPSAPYPGQYPGMPGQQPPIPPYNPGAPVPPPYSAPQGATPYGGVQPNPVPQQPAGQSAQSAGVPPTVSAGASVPQGGAAADAAQGPSAGPQAGQPQAGPIPYGQPQANASAPYCGQSQAGPGAPYPGQPYYGQPQAGPGAPYPGQPYYGQPQTGPAPYGQPQTNASAPYYGPVYPPYPVQPRDPEQAARKHDIALGFAFAAPGILLCLLMLLVDLFG